MPRLMPVCFPVWRFAHCADPYMASIRHIRKSCTNDPELEAVLIGSVFDQIHNELFARSRAAEAEAAHA